MRAGHDEPSPHQGLLRTPSPAEELIDRAGAT